MALATDNLRTLDAYLRAANHLTAVRSTCRRTRSCANRYYFSIDALRRSRRQLPDVSALTEECKKMLDRHRAYVAEHLKDMPEIRDWRWAAE